MLRISYNQVEDQTPHYGSILAINAQSDPTQKIKISPIGDVKGVDGRNYHLDAQRVIKRTQEHSVDLVLNVNHGWDTYGHKAAGWFDINSLEIRDDGIYASLAPTSIGTELIEQRHFRYLSPEYLVARADSGTMEVLSLAGVGLVNKPNLLDEALNKTQTKEANMPNEKSNSTNQSAQLETLAKENATLKKQLQINKIEAAISSGKLMPSKKEFAMQLNGQMLDDFLAVEAKDMEHLGSSIDPAREQDNAISPEEQEVIKQLGLQEDK